MARGAYEARDVLKILGVKAHVLRYWEQSLPLLRPERGDSGRRIWSAAQLRMLLRVRHLVVERGMSVAAAGNEVVREADSGTADTKARLEALRARLLTILLRVQAAGAAGVAHDPNVEAAGFDAIATAASPQGRARRQDPTAAQDPGAIRLREVAPGAMWRPWRNPVDESSVVATLLVGSGQASGDGAQPGAAVPALSPVPALDYVCTSHLWSDGAPGEVARMVGRIIAEQPETRRWVIPAPGDATEEYQRALNESGLGPERVVVVGLDPISYGSNVWWSPRLALLLAIAAQRFEDLWPTAPVSPWLYLTAPEDHSLPNQPGLSWMTAAQDSATGITVAGTPDGEAVRIAEAAVVFRPKLMARIETLATTGRRRWVSASPDRDPPWRYDVWQRDIAAATGAVFRIPHRNRVRPWPGRHWLREMHTLLATEEEL